MWDLMSSEVFDLVSTAGILCILYLLKCNVLSWNRFDLCLSHLVTLMNL